MILVPYQVVVFWDLVTVQLTRGWDAPDEDGRSIQHNAL